MWTFRIIETSILTFVQLVPSTSAFNPSAVHSHLGNGIISTVWTNDELQVRCRRSLCLCCVSGATVTGYSSHIASRVGKGKAVPLQAWSGSEGSRNLRFPDIKTTAQDGGKVDSLTHRPPLPPGNTPGTHFC
jgi:hypothetical protein